MGDHESYSEGMAAYHAGRYGDVITHLTPLASHGEGAIRLLGRFYVGQAHYRLAVRLFEQRRFRDAGNHFRAAAQMNPAGGGVARFLAACHSNNHDLEELDRQLREQVRLNPDDADSRIRLALVQWKLGQPAEAVTLLREGIERKPDHADLHYQLGVMMAAEERFDEARVQFETTIGLDACHALAHERLGQCCGVARKTDQAIEHLQRAHKLDPSNSRVALQLSILAGGINEPPRRPQIILQPASGSSRYDQADIDRLGETIVEEPDFVEAFLQVPASDVDQEVFTVLRATLERALEKHPEFADLHYHCGQIYHRLGRDRNAIQQIERAIQINPQYVQALILLARLYGQTDRWAAGLERLQQAVEAGADYPDVHYLLGQLYQRGNQPERARQAYQRALDLKSDYRPAREALESLTA
jgi:tetratricopeptide (TPR) repeat protein